jgi:hypothetical protein
MFAAIAVPLSPIQRRCAFTESLHLRSHCWILEFMQSGHSALGFSIAVAVSTTLAAGLDPTSDCGPDLGHQEGYQVSIPDGKIERHVTIGQLEDFPGICLENLHSSGGFFGK